MCRLAPCHRNVEFLPLVQGCKLGGEHLLNAPNEEYITAFDLWEVQATVRIHSQLVMCILAKSCTQEATMLNAASELLNHHSFMHAECETFVNAVQLCPLQ